MPLLLAQGLEKLTATTEVLPFFQALCGVLGALVAFFFFLWQRENAKRWEDREAERNRWRELAITLGGRKEGSHGDSL